MLDDELVRYAVEAKLADETRSADREMDDLVRRALEIERLRRSPAISAISGGELRLVDETKTTTATLPCGSLPYGSPLASAQSVLDAARAALGQPGGGSPEAAGGSGGHQRAAGGGREAHACALARVCVHAGLRAHRKRMR